MSLGPKRYTKRIALLAAGVVATSAAGNSLLRLGLSSAGPLIGFSPTGYLKEFASPTVILAVAILALGFILQLSLLSWADLTYAIPITSAQYQPPGCRALPYLRKPMLTVIDSAHWLGVLLILCGVLVVSRTKPLTTGRRE